jgi:hypothetical protein
MHFVVEMHGLYSGEWCSRGRASEHCNGIYYKYFDFYITFTDVCSSKRLILISPAKNTVTNLRS